MHIRGNQMLAHPVPRVAVRRQHGALALHNLARTAHSARKTPGVMPGLTQGTQVGFRRTGVTHPADPAVVIRVGIDATQNHGELGVVQEVQDVLRTVERGVQHVAPEDVAVESVGSLYRQGDLDVTHARE